MKGHSIFAPYWINLPQCCGHFSSSGWQAEVQQGDILSSGIYSKSLKSCCLLLISIPIAIFLEQRKRKQYNSHGVTHTHIHTFCTGKLSDLLQAVSWSLPFPSFRLLFFLPFSFSAFFHRSASLLCYITNLYKFFLVEATHSPPRYHCEGTVTL